MSSNMSNKNNKNSKLFSQGSIVYMEDANKSELNEMMKKGYLEMSQINLQLAIETELVDINNYESWLSGEWYVIWQMW